MITSRSTQILRIHSEREFEMYGSDCYPPASNEGHSLTKGRR
ncbi:MAG: hypothetical protein OJF47_001023 [Nitrospira sp.]|nr:MAG: hypothetical protein OJF47_001023 [Nitrospira sp.]